MYANSRRLKMPKKIEYSKCPYRPDAIIDSDECISNCGVCIRYYGKGLKK